MFYFYLGVGVMRAHTSLDQVCLGYESQDTLEYAGQKKRSSFQSWDCVRDVRGMNPSMYEAFSYIPGR